MHGANHCCFGSSYDNVSACVSVSKHLACSHSVRVPASRYIRIAYLYHYRVLALSASEPFIATIYDFSDFATERSLQEVKEAGVLTILYSGQREDPCVTQIV